MQERGRGGIRRFALTQFFSSNLEAEITQKGNPEHHMLPPHAANVCGGETCVWEMSLILGKKKSTFKNHRYLLIPYQHWSCARESEQRNPCHPRRRGTPMLTHLSHTTSTLPPSHKAHPPQHCRPLLMAAPPSSYLFIYLFFYSRSLALCPPVFLVVH